MEALGFERNLGASMLRGCCMGRVQFLNAQLSGGFGVEISHRGRMDPLLEELDMEEEVDYDLDDDFLNQGFEEEDALREAELAKELEEKEKARAEKSEPVKQKQDQLPQEKIVVQNGTQNKGTRGNMPEANQDGAKPAARKRIPIPIPPKSFANSVNPLDKKGEANKGNSILDKPLSNGQRNEGGRGWGRGGRMGRGGRDGGQNPHQGGRFDQQGGRGGRGMFPQQFPSNLPFPPQMQFPGPNNQNHQTPQIPQWGMHNQNVQRPIPGSMPFNSGLSNAVVQMQISGGMPISAMGGLPMPPNMGMLNNGSLAETNRANAWNALDNWSPPRDTPKNEDRNRSSNSASEISRRSRQNPGQGNSFFAHGMDSRADLSKRKRITERLSVVPRLAGEDEDSPPPAKRISPNRREKGNRGLFVAPGSLPIPPVAPTGIPQKPNGDEEAKARARQIQERIEAQKKENALIRKAEALKKEAELASLQKQIAFLEEQAKNRINANQASKPENAKIDSEDEEVKPTQRESSRSRTPNLSPNGVRKTSKRNSPTLTNKNDLRNLITQARKQKQARNAGGNTSPSVPSRLCSFSRKY